MSKRKEFDEQAPEESNALVTDADHVSLIERYPTGCLEITVNTPPERWPTSMEVGSEVWQAAIINANCTPDVQVGEQWSEPFTVVHWLVMVRETIDDKTGEVNRYPWTALFCKDGDIVGSSGQVVPHQLARALRVKTDEQWREGVQFKIRRRPNRAGVKSYHELRVL